MKKVVKHPSLCIGKNMLVIERHIDRYSKEVHAFWFFAPDHVPKACEVIAIADWAKEINRLSSHPILEILVYFKWPYFSTR